jgi:tetraacyldisaccharide 4'-kinase
LKSTIQHRLLQHWFAPPAAAVLPEWQASLLGLLERLYLAAWRLREWAAARTPPARAPTGVHVIAIGNLLVGGAGKTPCVMALALALRAAGTPVGILSRGYKSRAERGRPTVLLPYNLMNLSPDEVGDEAWLLAWRTESPVAVSKNRRWGLEALLRADPSIQVVLLDDGLQQRTLAWDQSLLIMDDRALGNGHCLPAGPLREPALNLKRFSYWVDNGLLATPAAKEPLPPELLALIEQLPPAAGLLKQTLGPWVPLEHWRNGNAWLSTSDGVAAFRGRSILAVAGIAVPERFFKLLTDLGLEFDRLALDDHDPELVAHVIGRWQVKNYDVVLMTEKDAVKFFHHNTPLHSRAWALRREAQLEPDLLKRLIAKAH